MRFIPKIFTSDDELLEGDDAEVLGDESADEDEEGELALDIFQTKDSVVVKSTIAGVKPEDLDITIADNLVTIRGERKQEEQIKKEDYLLTECYWGGFYRSFELPVEVDADKANADIKDGILTLTLPKLAKSRTKKVKVKQQMGE
jgi:HSP20 family protein